MALSVNDQLLSNESVTIRISDITSVSKKLTFWGMLINVLWSIFFVVGISYALTKKLPFTDALVWLGAYLLASVALYVIADLIHPIEKLMVCAGGTRHSLPVRNASAAYKKVKTAIG